MRFKRILSLLVAMIMALGCVGITAMAEENVAQIGETGYATLQAAIDAAQNGETITLLDDVNESIAKMEGCTLTTNVEGGVTITNTYVTDYVDFNNVTIGSGVTLNIPNVLSSGSNSVNVIEGTLNVSGVYYHSGDAKTTIRNGGNVTTDGMTIVRYNENVDSGIYIYGDSNDETVEFTCNGDAIGAYSGAFYAKDAVIVTKSLRLDYKKDSSEESDDYAPINAEFENSVVNVSVDLRLYKDAHLTLVRTDVIVETVQIRENATPVVSVDSTSSVNANEVMNLAGATLNAVLGTDGTVTFKAEVAKIGVTNYETLAAAIAAAEAGDTITLLSDVTVTEKFSLEGVNLDLNNKTLYLKTTGNYIIDTVTISNGTINISDNKVDGNTFFTVGGRLAKAGSVLNLDKVKLVGDGYTTEWAVICAHNGTSLNITDSTVDLKNDNGTGGGFIKDTSGVGNTAIVTIKDSTITLADVDRGFTGAKVTLENVTLTITGGEHGINGSELIVKDSTVSISNGTGRGITLNKFDSKIVNSTVTLTNMGEGGIRFKTANALTVDDASTLAATSAHADVVGATLNDYAVTGTEDDMSTVTVANGTTTVVNAVYVAEVNGVKYKTLQDALKAVTDNSTVTLLADITISDKWDCRYNGAKITASNVTIDGNNHTLKLTGEINDNNWNTVFRFENVATVKNLTIDVSEATGVQRGISSKLSITAENCTFIGNGTSSKRAIIFGEGAGTELPNVTATITGCTFKNWTLGVSDNQSGKDAKSVSVTGSIFNNASALVSALETVTFTGNTVNNGYVNIKSYTADNTCNVTATGNTLDLTKGEDNKIDAGGTINAQDEFVVPATGTNSLAYTKEVDGYVRVWGEGSGNAKESFVLKLYSEDTLMATTKLNNIGGIIDGDVNVTWNFFYPESNDEYWTTTWEKGHPNALAKPTKVELYIDGTLVATTDVQMNAPDNLNPVVWEELGGVMEPVLPNAEVTNLGIVSVTANDGDGDYTFGKDYYYVYDLLGNQQQKLKEETAPFEMNIAMQFVAKDSPEEAAANAYAKYTTDFFIKIEGIENGSFIGDDCYLAGYYPSFGAWVKIPLDGFKVENGVVYPVISTAGFDFSYVDICTSVEDFICGIYITPEILAKNPGISVNLTLGLSENLEAAQGAVFEKVDDYTYDADDFFGYVAQIGDNKYTSLQAAVDAAQNDDTITLLADISLAEGVVIAADDVIVLELNGKVISRKTEEATSTAAITNNGNLTIQDSEGTGKITAFANNPDKAAIPYYANNTITNCGVLTIKSGKIENSTSDEARAAFPIDNNSTVRDAIVNIEGGVITGRGAIRQFANSTTNMNEVKITGGEVSGTSYGVWVQNPGSGDPRASIKVSGGTVAKILLSPSSNFKAAITGGTISEVAIWDEDETNAERNPAGFISGGTFSSNVSAYCAEGYTCEKNADDTYGVKADFYGTNTTLGNALDINFAIAKDYFTGADYYAEIKHYKENETITKQIPLSDWESAGNYYKITYAGLAAKEITDTVEITIYKNDGTQVSVKRTDGLKAYAERQIKKYAESGDNPEQLKLFVDMLNYGAAAQEEFNYKINDLANANIETYQQYASEKTPVISDIRDSATGYVGTNLVLENRILLNAAFEGVTDDMSVTVAFNDHYGNSHSKTLTYSDLEKREDFCIVPVNDLVVADAGQNIKITINRNDGTVYTELTDSVNSYLSRMMQSNKIYEMIAKFTASAYEYLHKQ